MEMCACDQEEMQLSQLTEIIWEVIVSQLSAFFTMNKDPVWKLSKQKRTEFLLNFDPPIPTREFKSNPDPNKEFVCGICLELINIPIVCDACQTLACKSCVESSESCPFCRKVPFLYGNASRYVRDVIHGIRGKCDHCKESMTLQEFRVHEKSPCPHPFLCPLHCGERILPDQLKEHSLSCPHLMGDDEDPAYHLIYKPNNPMGNQWKLPPMKSEMKPLVDALVNIHDEWPREKESIPSIFRDMVETVLSGNHGFLFDPNSIGSIVQLCCAIRETFNWIFPKMRVYELVCEIRESLHRQDIVRDTSNTHPGYDTDFVTWAISCFQVTAQIVLSQCISGPIYNTKHSQMMTYLRYIFLKDSPTFDEYGWVLQMNNGKIIVDMPWLYAPTNEHSPRSPFYAKLYLDGFIVFAEENRDILSCYMKSPFCNSKTIEDIKKRTGMSFE